MINNTSLSNSVSVKRKQTCGKCGQIGHNKRSCKAIIESIPIEPLIVHNDEHIIISKKLISEHSYISQCELIDILKKSYQNKIISEIFEEIFINDKRFSNIDHFKKYFLDNNLNIEYPIYNLWYYNQDDLSLEITDYILRNDDINHIPVTSQCGSGKTMAMDSIVNRLMITPIEDYTRFININNIFVITGYSSKEWITDMKKNLKIIKSDNVFHRDTIKNLKNIIIKDYKRLLNAVLFIDEARLVVEPGMTIDKFFKELGLEPEIISRYNIKIFYIDATLDSHNISLKDLDNVSEIVFQMEPGENYIGVNHSMDYWLKKIGKYNLKHDIGFNKIFKRIKKLKIMSKNKHLFRITDSKTRNKFIRKINELGYTYYLVDSSKDSHQWGEHSFDEELSKVKENVSIYILKDMYRCSKRFRLNEYIGIIYEQDTTSDTITTQGLIARFFGYYPDLTNIKPFMICNLDHFKNQKYELENGEPHESYKTNYVKGDRLLKPTWNSELLNSTENSKRTIKKSFDDGYITSGSTCKELIDKYIEENGSTEKLNKLITHNNLMDRCEVFTEKEEAKNRYTELTGNVLGSRFRGGTVGHNETRMNAFGNINIFSNMSINKTDMDKKFNDDINYIETRIYNYKDNGNEKFAIRWITKI